MLLLLIFLQYSQIFSKYVVLSDSFINPKHGLILTKKPDKSLWIFLHAIAVSKHLDLLSAENTPKRNKTDSHLFSISESTMYADKQQLSNMWYCGQG